MEGRKEGECRIGRSGCRRREEARQGHKLPNKAKSAPQIIIHTHPIKTAQTQYSIFVVSRLTGG
jgi:hypothetical protein